MHRNHVSRMSLARLRLDTTYGLECPMYTARTAVYVILMQTLSLIALGLLFTYLDWASRVMCLEETTRSPLHASLHTWIHPKSRDIHAKNIPCISLIACDGLVVVQEAAMTSPPSLSSCFPSFRENVAFVCHNLKLSQTSEVQQGKPRTIIMVLILNDLVAKAGPTDVVNSKMNEK